MQSDCGTAASDGSSSERNISNTRNNRNNGNAILHVHCCFYCLTQVALKRQQAAEDCIALGLRAAATDSGIPVLTPGDTLRMLLSRAPLVLLF